jgi:Mg2+ and Co2+ transporter CorA|tara:strand:+ start:262 stop:456 length:195 start_codon:yes stop_codon:yes gene_type:complete
MTDIEKIQERVRELEMINETHQQLNGQLRQELKLLETENIKDKNLLQGYKKVIEELTDKLNKKS